MNLLAWVGLSVLAWTSWRALMRGAKKRRDARNRQRYQEGFNYVRDSLLVTGPLTTQSPSCGRSMRRAWLSTRLTLR